MLNNEHFWDLLKDQSDDSVGWWWNWPDEVSWQMTDEKDNDNDKYLVKTLGKWQMKKTTTVETRIIARLQSRDCWVALRSRSLSENKYLSDRHRNNWKQSLLTEYHYYIIIYNIYKPVVEEPFVTVFPISNRHLRLRKLRRRKGGGFWLYTEDSLKITCGMS